MFKKRKAEKNLIKRFERLFIDKAKYLVKKEREKKS